MSVTWKVWAPDAVSRVYESEDPSEAADDARRRTEAGEAVILESPDGIDCGWDPVAGAWRSLNDRFPVPPVLAGESDTEPPPSGPEVPAS
ncbi:hypothetical protein [Streptomyces lunaelactis]|uniref:hypothetical protein n=1 Tax=Streptomyces lunaelactis TaxID=1535768 RepID=UPI001585A420|nr:hypothetical protein [Streptomyces lunaelactis]NUK86725.1 hypothetical protein [Streptomyces lunaelactis]